MSYSQPPLVLPRGLIFLASMWLIASWLIALGIRTPVHPSSASYTPGVRMMLLYVMLGLFVGWPLLRLSQSRSPWPFRQILLDLLVLASLLQVVLWPLRLVTTWTPMRTAAIDATIVGWMVLVSVIVASVVGRSAKGPRCLAMIVCLLVCLAAPMLIWIGGAVIQSVTTMVLCSPLLAVWTLSHEGAAPVPWTVWSAITLLLAAGGFAWLALYITAGRGTTHESTAHDDARDQMPAEEVS